jgi:hypothetical protein
VAIAVDLDPAWTTNSGTNAVTSATFSPAANSLIIVPSVCDSGTGSITCVVTDSVGLTWTPIGTAQVGTGGGTVAASWAFTSASHAGMTVTATWSGSGTTSTKGVKPVTYTGTASTSAVVSKAQSTSTTNNLSVNVTNTNNGCRMVATGIEWNALGLPTSTDTAVAFHSAGNIDGISVYKAANTSGTGQTVTLNFDAGSTGAAAWSYKIFEIVPAGGTDATATPAVVAGVTAVPSVAVKTGSVVTPSIVSAVTAAPAVTIHTGSIVTPSVVAAVAAVDTPTVSTGGGGHGIEAFDWGDPEFPDNSDGVGVLYTLGVEWYCAIDGDCTGVRWCAPTSLPGVNLYALLYEVSNTTPLAIKAFTWTAGGDVDVTFDSSVPITADTHYIAAVLTDRYSATAHYTWPHTDGDLTAPDSVNGCLASASADTPAYPSSPSGNQANFHVGPIVDTGGGDSTDATATPDVVSAVADVPTVTVSTADNATVQPGAVPGVTAVPAVSISTGSAVTPSTVTAVAGIPSPTVSAHGPGEEQHLLTTQTPDTPDANDSLAYTLGTLVVSDTDGLAIGCRWYFPATLPSGPVAAVLYSYDSETGGTELASGTFASPTAGGWNTAPFDTPADITAGPRYVWAIHTPDRYVAASGLFASDVVTGHLTGPADDTVTPVRNGRLDLTGSATGPAFPHLGTGGGYLVDPVVLFGDPVDAGATPAVVVGTATVPTVTVSHLTSVTPATVQAIAAVPVAGVSASTKVAAPAVAATAAVGAFESVEIDVTIDPATVAAVAAIPSSTVSASAFATVAATTVTAIASVPAPAVSAGGSATVAASTVAATASVPAPTVSASAVANPTAVAAVAAVLAPAVTTSASATAAASTVRAIASIPTPRIPVASTGGRLRSRVRTSHITSRVRSNDLNPTGA